MSNSSDIRDLIEAIAADLAVDACFVEKDWYATRIIGALSRIEHPEMQLVFSGGTSLSKGFGIIQRFSEDLDFKVRTGDRPPSRKERKVFREQIITTLDRGRRDWEIDIDSIEIGNNSNFFKVPIRYQTRFDLVRALRPFVQLEITFENPLLPPELRPLQSFVGQALKQDPEAIAFPCISPIETAADKLSALAWRVRERDRTSSKDDPRLIRHLHDLAALDKSVSFPSDFTKLVENRLEKDSKRVKNNNLYISPKEFLDFLLITLETDRVYKDEYEGFVSGMSYAEPAETLTFEDGIKALKRMIELF